MLTLREEHSPPVTPGTTVFYLYAADVTSMHAMLAANGVRHGAIAFPDYMPKGEFDVWDPDGYKLTVAQAGPDTP
jgi:hypothetical protein